MDDFSSIFAFVTRLPTGYGVTVISLIMKDA